MCVALIMYLHLHLIMYHQRANQQSEFHPLFCWFSPFLFTTEMFDDVSIILDSKWYL